MGNKGADKKKKKTEKKKTDDQKVQNSVPELYKIDEPPSALEENHKKKKNSRKSKQSRTVEEVADAGEANVDSVTVDVLRNHKKRKSAGDMENSKGTDIDAKSEIQSQSKKSGKKKKKHPSSSMEGEKVLQKDRDAEADDVYHVSSGDEDCTKGMKKWISEYRQQRPGLKILQDRIDDFIVAHEAQLEQERKEKEAQAAEGGWTVVVHHKGRKKTTDTESGIAVGSVAQAAVEGKVAKKKNKEIVSDFYRFQKREAKRNEIMMLQSKFEEDRKRIQQLRAARKFRPY